MGFFNRLFRNCVKENNDSITSNDISYDKTLTISKRAFLNPSNELEAELNKILNKAPLLNEKEVKALEGTIPSNVISKEGSIEKVIQQILSCLKRDYVDLKANRQVRKIDKIELDGVTDLKIRLFFTNVRGQPIFLQHVVYRKDSKLYKCLHHGKKGN